MSIKPLVILPNPLLREVSRPVATVDDRIIELSNDMLKSMYHASGIGLAAIQIGVLLRLLVIDITGNDKPKNPRIFINPEVIWRSDEQNIYKEGCLSIPDYYAEIKRSRKVCVTYIERDGRKKEIEADGLLATCLQHEIDHLNGILFIDHISRLRRDIIIRKFKKKARNIEEGHMAI
ncbi:MAG: peptide deformylase [Candidatus Tokpelaia sp. JSC188]|nr:MAG: peptide deformylase [Candidatus Tokpelaia sp. JSC188]